jgi:hypothetical protein
MRLITFGRPAGTALRVPVRINWINTALAKSGFPVALITTPPVLQTPPRSDLKKQLAGMLTSFIGRIGHVERLPEGWRASDLARP